MGYAIAQAAADMGAIVTLVSGASELNAPDSVNTIKATSSDAMYKAVMGQVGNQDIFISVAAVADYRPSAPHAEKIKKNSASLTLALSPNKDILAEVASLPKAPFCVGFAAETEKLLDHAEAKRQAKKLPLMVANLVSDAMGDDDNTVTLLDKNGAHPLERAPKSVIAELLLKHVVSML